MAGKNDLAGLLRGLDLIRKALADSQGKELRHMWENSSLKSAAEGVGAKVQENINKGTPVSDLSVSDNAFSSKQGWQNAGKYETFPWPQQQILENTSKYWSIELTTLEFIH